MLKPSRFRTKRQRPAVPKGLRVYAIGDVHGRLDLLNGVLSRIDADLSKRPSSAAEIYLGDYIDRGSASREVLDRLIARSFERNTVFLKGNHETFVASFIDNPSVLNAWQQIGGLETLMSYGLRPSIKSRSTEQHDLAQELRAVLPKAHEDFLSKLRLSVSCGDFFFVHAGVRPGVPLMEQREDDLLWIRDDFLLWEESFEKIIVHGHTPVRELDIRANRINIDTGAYATGRLTCLVIEDDEVAVLS